MTVATINMVVALLVLILERTQMIGILKVRATIDSKIFFTTPLPYLQRIMEI
jgi:hypothetical protein